MTRTAPALTFALVLASGCTPDVTLGDTCAYDSECREGLACRFGRCRAECLAARDCPDGQDCVLDARGQGACTLVQDRSCGASGCPDGLVCGGDDVCRQPCDARACAAEMQCVEQVCVRPVASDAGAFDADAALDASEPDGGPPADAGPCIGDPCDPVRDCGCDAGQRCAVVRGDATCVSAGGTATVGASCTTAADCAAGLGCHAGSCYEYCSDHADCSTEGTWCERSAPPPGVTDLGTARVCSRVCDVLTGGGCPAGVCSLGVAATGLVSRCSTPGARAIDTVCDATYECVALTFCEGSIPGGLDRACRALCSNFGAPCTNGGTCVRVGELHGADIGLCFP